jgi:Phage integrase family
MGSTALATRPVVSLVAQAAGAGLRRYVQPDQARSIINAAETTAHRLLLECLWQSGGRITEVLRLRPYDLDLHEGALRLINLKQRKRANRTKLVHVDKELVGDLRRLAPDARIPANGYLFGARQHVGPISRQYAWRFVNRYAQASGVVLPSADGRLCPATARDFRHGSAVHQVRQGVPLSEVAQQLGDARLDTTSIYTKLANAERRAIADRVQWWVALSTDRPGVRRCSDCGQNKRLTEFTQNKGTPWYHRRCKACRARRAWEQNHPSERCEDWLQRRADEAEGRVTRRRPTSRICTGLWRGQAAGRVCPDSGEKTRSGVRRVPCLRRQTRA